MLSTNLGPSETHLASPPQEIMDGGWREGRGQQRHKFPNGLGSPRVPRQSLKSHTGTAMVKNIGPRLREIASLATGSQDARSHNLGPTFFYHPCSPTLRFPLISWVIISSKSIDVSIKLMGPYHYNGTMPFNGYRIVCLPRQNSRVRGHP